MKTSSLLNLVTILGVTGIDACPTKCNIDAATVSLEGVSQAFDYLRKYTFEAVNTNDCLLKRQKLYALCGGLIDRVEGLAEISEDNLKAPTTATKSSDRLIRPAQNHLGQVRTMSVSAAPNDQCTWQGDFQGNFAKGYEAIQNAFKTLSVLGSIPRCHPAQCQDLVNQYSQDIKAILEAVQTIESTINICASLTKESAADEKARCPVNSCDLRAAIALVSAAVTINPYVVGQADAVTTPCQCALVSKAYNQNAIALAQVVYFALSTAANVFKPETPKASRPGECAQRYADIITIANASVNGAQKAIDGIRCCSTDDEVIFNSGLLDVFANTYEAVPLGFLLAIDFCNTTCHCPCGH